MVDEPVPLLSGVVEDMVCGWLLELDGETNAVTFDCDRDLPGLVVAIDGKNETFVSAELALPEELLCCTALFMAPPTSDEWWQVPC